MANLAFLLLALACGDGTGDSGSTTDGGSTDGGSSDGGTTDGGTSDGGGGDGGSIDGGAADGGSIDGGAADGGAADGGSADGGSGDGGFPVAPLVINEFMASNATTIADPAGGFADWLELYNPTTADVSLEGWTITDDRAIPDKFALDASLHVPAGGFLILWADGDVKEGPDHLSFRLHAAGEELGLYGPDGSEQDGFAYGKQATDISAARVPDGSETWVLTDAPTPGASNGTGR